MRLLAGLAAALVALTTVPLLVAPAEAASYTSSGVRCTVTGTTGDDALVGTPRRDVLCGLGGDDTIRGLGGNDVVDGGHGHDEILAGGGSDRVSAGPGADEVAGGPGSDLLYGGPGSDELAGGGAGDLLAGQDGDDDLAGGPGADDVRGGGGTNWCTIDSADERTRCVYDTAPAEIAAGALSRSTVDVTTADQAVRIRVRVTDDTGVTRVDTALTNEDGTAWAASSVYPRLVSGDVRDGIWEAEVHVPRWSAPGTFLLAVNARDRLGRWSGRSFPAVALTVRDRNPDVDPPRATLLQPLPDADPVNVRAARQDVTVKARVTDAVSGVASVSVCLLKPQDDHYTNLQCTFADLVTGDIRDGIWRGSVTIPRGATGGDWNVEVAVADRANSGDLRYMGPDAYRFWTDGGTRPDPSVTRFAGGRGRFQVLGTHDSVAATIEEVQVRPGTVTTLAGPATVTVRVHATDAPAEGVDSVGGAFGSDQDGSSSGPDGLSFLMADFVLVEGTPADGWWEASTVLPQGTPAGTYYLQVWVEDSRHWRTYLAAPSTSHPDALRIPGDATVVVEEAGP